MSDLFWIGYLAGLGTLLVPLIVFLWLFGHLIFTNPRDW